MNLLAFAFGLPGVMRGLDESAVDADPVRQFGKWFRYAKRARIHQPHAMCLASSSADGKPSARMVLLKSFDESGFVFYTNYESRKAGELEANPKASLLFFWSELHRQVRIEGSVARVSREESERYFHSRPRASQIGAWASDQSRPIGDRNVLDRRYLELTREHEGREVPLPPQWGGFRLSPVRMEFWQGRAHRLHDRIVYTRDDGAWKRSRLAP